MPFPFVFIYLCEVVLSPTSAMRILNFKTSSCNCDLCMNRAGSVDVFLRFDLRISLLSSKVN